MKNFRVLLAAVGVAAMACAGCGSGTDSGELPDGVIADADLDVLGDSAGDGVDLDARPQDLSGMDLKGMDLAGMDLGWLDESPVDADAEVPEDGIDDVPVDAADSDVELPPLEHSFVYEVRTRETCLPDGPWKVDRVRQFRDSSSGLGSMNIRHVTVTGGNVWVITDDGLYVGQVASLVQEGTFHDATGDLPDSDLNVMYPSSGGILLEASGSVVLFDEGGNSLGPQAGTPPDVEQIIYCGDSLLALVGGTVFDVSSGIVDLGIGEQTGMVHSIACDGGSMVLGSDLGVFVGEDAAGLVRRWDSGSIPVSSVAAGGGIVAASTGESLVLLDTAGWTPVILVPGRGGLPTGGIVDVDVSSDGRLVAIAHGTGVTVINRQPGDVEGLSVGRVDVGLDVPATMDHFHSLRWLPSDTVNEIAFGQASNDLWVATPAGLSRIWSEDIALADKADRMFENLNNWFWRLDGFVSAWARFDSAYSDVQMPLQDDDNDGQWTQEAVGAFCYAYRVTGDERWYEAARKAITNMALQIDIPAQDFIDAGLGRGFITRSFVRDDEGDVYASKATQPNWHHVAYMDGHEYYWKDDTSSDELTGHFYGFSIYYDLCAKDDTERSWVAEHLTALVGYILDHGYRLLDLDGEPTEHGKYGPEYLAVAVDGLEACSLLYDIETCLGAWGGGAFLDSTEILGGLLAAWHVSGQPRFYDAYESLVSQYRYDELATFSENVLTWTNPAIANYCDHELSDLAMMTLLRYEQRSDRRAIWAKSILDAYQYEIGERNPLKTLAMAAVMADPPGVAAGVSTLVDFPEDQRDYLVDNSHRVDAGRMGKDRFETAQFDTVFPYDEIQSMRWDANPYRVVDGGSPQSRRAPNFWLLPYWGLRYYGVIGDSCQNWPQ